MLYEASFWAVIWGCFFFFEGRKGISKYSFRILKATFQYLLGFWEGCYQDSCLTLQDYLILYLEICYKRLFNGILLKSFPWILWVVVGLLRPSCPFWFLLLSEVLADKLKRLNTVKDSQLARLYFSYFVIDLGCILLY